MSAPTLFHGGRVALHAGDCLEILRAIPDCSVDSVCTDPPYHLVSIVRRFGSENAAPALSAAERRFAKTGGADRQPGTDQYGRLSRGFMGKTWDGGDIAFRVELWAEVFRVLKPGGHVVAFSGTRTYHRMACAIEDAGFEIRDRIEFDHDSQSEYAQFEASLSDEQRSQFTKLFKEHGAGSLSWKFGTGFPKSHNVKKGAQETVCRCAASDDQLRGLRGDEGYAKRLVQEDKSPNLLETMQRSFARVGMGDARAQGPEGKDAGVVCESRDARFKESGVEGRRDVPAQARELREREIRSVPTGISGDGADGRLCDGASFGDGAMGGATSDSVGNGASSGPCTSEQREVEFGALAGQSEPQTSGAWPLCERCSKPIIPDGWGTALKPACEPICFARKPLSEKTVAENVLAHRTGAINIDGCRVPTADVLSGSGTPPLKFSGDNSRPFHDSAVPLGCNQNPAGRHPANVVHDGSPEVVGCFPAEAGAAAPVRGTEASAPTAGIYGERGRVAGAFHADSGSAARFFYSAKADADDRLGSKHPTVKPVDLMRWLVRLVTPPGGTVLDPFAGTGTTGHAALLEGFNAILIEREEEYRADIARRMSLVYAGPTERSHAIVKAKGEDEDHESLPLFGGDL